nr:ShlB/FhaC/HecB family hemolysin secretion/activation protein [Petrachloros mirabilis]
MVGLLVVNLPTLAQPSPDPSRIEQQLPPPTLTLPEPRIDLPQQEELTPPSGAEDLRFQLLELEIEGVTVYAPEQLQPFYQAFLNQETTLLDLYNIANQITRLYRQDGYILSLAIVPEQTIETGVARIQVIEGYVEEAEFEGASPRQLRRLQGFGDKIVAARPLNIRALERYLLLANDLAGIEVRAILRRGSELGAAQLLGRVTHNPVEGFGNLTNRGTDAVGPLRAQAGVYLNSPLAQGEAWLLRGATVPNDPPALGFGGFDFALPVGHEGLTFNANTSFTGVRPGGDLKVFQLRGRTFAVGAGVSYPLVRSRTTNLFIGGSYDYADSRSTTDFTGIREVLSQDRLHVLRFNLEAEQVDPYGLTLGAIQLSQGIAGTRPSTATEPLSRAEGSAIFTKLNFNVGRIQPLPGEFSFRLQGTAQVTGDTLLARERFGLGGSIFGSAFDPDQILGDSGYGFRAELRRSFLYSGLGLTQATQPYIFADYGQVFRNTRTLAENRSDTLSSAGLGVRHEFGSLVSVGLELAFPVQSTDPSTRSDPRVFFVVTGFF